MTATPDIIRLKYSSDGDAAIRAAIATSGTDPITTGELVVGIEDFRVRLYSKDATGRIVEAVSGTSPPTIDGGDFNTAFPVLNIGDVYGGGYYGGLISFSENYVATHALIVSPKDVGEFNLQYKTTNTAEAGAASDKDGYANTQNVNDINHPAAQYARTLNISGYTDWYIPSRFELDILYYYLKPSTAANSTSKTFVNTIAMTDPPRNEYTASNPLRTSATVFQTGESQVFIPLVGAFATYYGSSTQVTGSTTIRSQTFHNSTYATSGFTATTRFRAIRKIAL